MKLYRIAPMTRVSQTLFRQRKHTHPKRSSFLTQLHQNSCPHTPSRKRLTFPWNQPKDNSNVCIMLLVRPVKSPGNTSGLRTSQAHQEILGFLGPSASDLAGDHHQPRVTITTQLWVCFFLVLACLRQCLPISGVHFSSECAISVQRRDHSDVYGQLAATKQRRRCDVDVSEHNVRGLFGPLPLCKSARRHFPLQIFFCQAHTLCCMLRGGCQKRRMDGHTGKCKQ